MRDNPLLWALGIAVAAAIRYYVYKLLRGRR
jgi:hypothetical protein